MIYEVHITSPATKLDSSWKKLVIELDSGDNPIQPMYSKYYNVNSFQVLWSRIKDIKCSRLKIEQYNNLPEHCVHPNYFEYHLKAKKDHAYLNDRPFGAHLSKNPQKEGRFLTLRGYVCKREIDQRFEELKYNLKKRGLSFSNLQKEYVVYDSNINLDLNWK